ncbi:hypothetical protein VPH35_027551 [Triticum aestivum]|uniref:Uncharacterized protein n=1 Tax=Triticum aestivum TaxID=4565 RepID=A0A3B6C1Q7_WHEAT
MCNQLNGLKRYTRISKFRHVEGTTSSFQSIFEWPFSVDFVPARRFSRRRRRPVALHERPHALDSPGGVGEVREEVERVDAVRELHHLHGLPLPPQHVGVPPLPVLQRVEPADQHHRRRERLGQLGVLVGHVRRRVVAAGALRQERPPPEVRPPDGHDRHHAVQPQLRLRPLLAAEVRLHGQEAGEAHGVWGGRGRSPAVGRVVDYVAAGALPGEEAAGEVHADALVQPRDAVGVDEAERVHGVVVGGRVGVLGREAVLDGDHDGADAPAEAAAEAVEVALARGEHREAAAVEVDDDRERGLGRDGGGEGEDARQEAARRVDVEVDGADAGGVRARARAHAEDAVGDGVEAAVDGAVAAVYGVDEGRERGDLQPHRERQRRRRGARHLSAPASRFLHRFLGWRLLHLDTSLRLYAHELWTPSHGRSPSQTAPKWAVWRCTSTHAHQPYDYEEMTPNSAVDDVHVRSTSSALSLVIS